MVSNNCYELKAVTEFLREYERAFIELAGLILENATDDPERVKTFAFMVDLLARTLNAERDRVFDVVISLEKE